MATATPLQSNCSLNEAASDFPTLYSRYYTYIGLGTRLSDEETQKSISQLNRWFDAKIKEGIPLSYVDIAKRAKASGLPHPLVAGFRGQRGYTKGAHFEEGKNSYISPKNRMRISGKFVGFEPIESDDEILRIIYLESDFGGLLAFKAIVPAEGKSGHNARCQMFGARHSPTVFYSYEF